MNQGSVAATENGIEPLPKAEQRKLDSVHLRDPLLTELGNDEIRFTEDGVQLLKFHGSYQQNHRELRKSDKVRCWQMMLRLRNPGGRVPARLFVALDELSIFLQTAVSNMFAGGPIALDWLPNVL